MPILDPTLNLMQDAKAGLTALADVSSPRWVALFREITARMAQGRMQPRRDPSDLERIGRALFDDQWPVDSNAIDLGVARD